MADASTEEIETITVPAAAGGRAAWLPAILAMVLSPVLTWAVVQFVLVPQLHDSLGGESAKNTAATVPPPGDSGGGSGEREDGPTTNSGYRMENVVVNLAGTMGTRYLKASFMVTGAHPELIPMFDAVHPQIVDVTLAVLSGLTLADLEEPGSKNVIRERLVDAYNQVFGGKVAENLYFSEFVVQ